MGTRGLMSEPHRALTQTHEDAGLYTTLPPNYSRDSMTQKASMLAGTFQKVLSRHLTPYYTVHHRLGNSTREGTKKDGLSVPRRVQRTAVLFGSESPYPKGEEAEEECLCFFSVHHCPPAMVLDHVPSKSPSHVSHVSDSSSGTPG